MAQMTPEDIKKRLAEIKSDVTFPDYTYDKPRVQWLINTLEASLKREELAREYLGELTICHCHEMWTKRDKHEPNCEAKYAKLGLQAMDEVK